MKIFEKTQPEELIVLLNDFKKVIDRTGTTTVAGRVSYLRKMLCGEALEKFDDLENQKNGATNAHLKSIQLGLLMYFFPKRNLNTEGHNLLCHAETLNGPFQDICGNTHQYQQLPTVVPRIRREQ